MVDYNAVQRYTQMGVYAKHEPNFFRNRHTYSAYIQNPNFFLNTLTRNVMWLNCCQIAGNYASAIFYIRREWEAMLKPIPNNRGLTVFSFEFTTFSTDRYGISPDGVEYMTALMTVIEKTFLQFDINATSAIVAKTFDRHSY